MWKKTQAQDYMGKVTVLYICKKKERLDFTPAHFDNVVVSEIQSQFWNTFQALGYKDVTQTNEAIFYPSAQPCFSCSSFLKRPLI